jgi:tetratricopeptide (TPR) repeat protein
MVTIYPAPSTLGAQQVGIYEAGRAFLLGSQSTRLLKRFEQTGQMADVDKAISAARQALKFVPAGHNRALSLITLSEALFARHRITEDLRDLDAAISAAEEAQSIFQQVLRDVPLGIPGRARDISKLGMMLRWRYQRTGQLADIDAAVTAGRRAVGLTGSGHSDRGVCQNNLATALINRYEAAGRADDLDMAITMGREALDALGPGDEFRATCQSNLGLALEYRFEKTGLSRDLDEAVALVTEAAYGTWVSDAEHASFLANFAVVLIARFSQTGEPEHVDRAISSLRQAIDFRAANDYGAAADLSNLGWALQMRFELKGKAGELDEALALMRRAADTVEEGDPARAAIMLNLSCGLWVRFDLNGQATDLDEAITWGAEAVAASPVGNFARAKSLANLGSAYMERFKRAGLVADIDTAIDLTRQAVEAIAPGALERSRYLANLSNEYLLRFSHARDANDLNDALSAAEEAARGCSPDDPNLAGFLSILGSALQTRYEHEGRTADLDAAITAGNRAVELSEPGDPWLGRYLGALGQAFRFRYLRTNEAADLDAAIERWREATEADSTSPRIRVQVALDWAFAALEEGRASSAADGFAVAVDLLPQVVWRGLDRVTQEDHLAGLAGLASEAAAAAIAAGQPRRAVELLEQGRQVLWTQALHLRSDLNRLQEKAPELASRLDMLRSQLDSPVPDSRSGGFSLPVQAGHHEPSPRRLTETRRQLAREWDDIIQQVRRLDGFEHFLKPVPFDEMRAGAAAGPVAIINVSRHGCHALIVTAGGEPGVQVVALQGLTYDEAANQANAQLEILGRTASGPRKFLEREQDRRRMLAILDWLWRTAAKPVLDAIGHIDVPDDPASPPHVWWCPTGPLTAMPLHAAGRYPELQTRHTVLRDTVPGRVVSSYAQSLTGLRNVADRSTAAPGPLRQLVVGLPDTPGYGSLRAVPAELQGMPTSLKEPEHAIHLVGEAATTEAVIDALPHCQWVHFACHAYQNDAEPSASAFALWDGSLTLAAIAGMRLKNAEFAYLSACQTAAGSTRLLDEALHLAAAMQLIGYRQVIATMWVIADAQTPEIVSAVYTELTDAGEPDARRAALALHNATARLRQAYPSNPIIWAQYIHLGPS